VNLILYLSLTAEGQNYTAGTVQVMAICQPTKRSGPESVTEIHF